MTVSLEPRSYGFAFQSQCSTVKDMLPIRDVKKDFICHIQQQRSVVGVIKSHGSTCVVFCPILLKNLNRKYVLEVVGAPKVVTSSFQHEIKMSYFGWKTEVCGT
jgi:hypothetical protein